DAAKAKSVSRRSIQAANIGELPTKLGPGLDALVRPLLPLVTASSTTPALASSSSVASSSSSSASSSSVASHLPSSMPTGRVAELLRATSISVCVDPNDATAWWFCDVKRGIAESEFATRYHDLTGATDLEKASSSSGGDVALSASMFVVGGLGAGG